MRTSRTLLCIIATLAIQPANAMTTIKKSHNRRGTAAVEFAIILPVLLIIQLGTIEICTMIFLKQSLTIAAFEAARVSVVPTTTSANVVDAATKVLKIKKVKDFNVTITPANFSAAAYGTFIRVDVTAPCKSNSPISPFYFKSQSLTASVELMKEF